MLTLPHYKCMFCFHHHLMLPCSFLSGGLDHLLLSQTHTPTQIFQNTLCIVCSQRLEGSSSGGPLASLCFLGSSWVVWGQKMCALKSSMSPVLSNTSVKLCSASKLSWGGASPQKRFCLGVLNGPPLPSLLHGLCSKPIYKLVARCTHVQPVL